MIQLITISGKAKQVFVILDLLAQKRGQETLEELQKWIAETLKGGKS